VPALAEARGARAGGPRVAGHPERERLLEWLRPRPHGREVDEVPAVRGHLVGPERATDGEVLVRAPPPALERHADRLELLPEPPDADREHDAPSRERIESCHLLGGHDGRTVGHDVGAHAEPDAGRRAGEEGERREWLVEMLDHADVARPRVRAPVVGIDGRDAGRCDEVVAHPDRVDAERLGASCEAREGRGAREGTVARERDPEAHGCVYHGMPTR
jgi:hypothetical protein